MSTYPEALKKVLRYTGNAPIGLKRLAVERTGRDLSSWLPVTEIFIVCKSKNQFALAFEIPKHWYPTRGM